MGGGSLATVVSRRTFGPTVRGRWLSEGRSSLAARLGAYGVGRTLWAPPLDGWPFVGGETALARYRLGLGWDARDSRLYAPPFGEVEF